MMMMKDLSLARLIPFAAGAVLIVGCGGRTVIKNDDTEPLIDGLPGGDPTKADPNDDAQFEAALDALTQDFCERTILCQGDDYYSYFGSPAECAELVGEIFEDNYRLDDPDCRSDLIDVLDCFSSLPECSEQGTDTCERAGERLYDRCYVERYDDYDDYDDWYYDY